LAGKSNETKSKWPGLLKLLLSAAMVTYVARQIDMGTLRQALKEADAAWLLAALFLFNVSIFLSAERLKICFEAVGVRIGLALNVLLYYVGMFYNLFLPGGIGGDGYKVYLLNRRLRHGVKPLFQAIVLDRLSGLAALVILTAVLFLSSGLRTLFPEWVDWAAWFGLLATLPIAWVAVRWFFRAFLPDFWRIFWWGMGVQLAQLAAAWAILHALGLTHAVASYLAIYLVSSVAAVLPVTVGGVGLREMTFLYAAKGLGEDPSLGVTFSFLFFMITAISSLAGLVLQRALAKRMQKEADR
jgi:uncharacterized membrane protein YbhN (UPF0104 family)